MTSERIAGIICGHSLLTHETALKIADAVGAEIDTENADLLAALRDMVHYDDLPEADKQPAVERARAAIAAATGGK